MEALETLHEERNLARSLLRVHGREKGPLKGCRPVYHPLLFLKWKLVLYAEIWCRGGPPPPSSLAVGLGYTISVWVRGVDSAE